MNPQHFGSDPTDIRLRIRINMEIRIQIPDHFWLTFCFWRRFALSEQSSYYLLLFIIMKEIMKRRKMFE